jgi:hypothetical protein
MFRSFLKILALVFVTTPLIYAQPVTGLWKLSSAEFGSGKTTPVDKWIRINPNGTFQSGDGWRETAEGRWCYNEKTGEFFPIMNDGTTDVYQPVIVSFEDSSMVWQSIEGISRGTIAWTRLDNLPLSPAEMIIGSWDLTSAQNNGDDVLAYYDPDNKYYIFIKKDGNYIEQTATGEQRSGLWHMKSDKSELAMIAQDNPSERWSVEVSGNSLKLLGLSDKNKMMILGFTRINKFPE